MQLLTRLLIAFERTEGKLGNIQQMDGLDYSQKNWAKVQ